MICSGCGISASSDATCPYKEHIVIDVFDTQANFQGIQSGWFAKIVNDKFNMELNIIAPNVAGGGDTLYQIRSTAGDLGDLVIVGADTGRLDELVKAGLVIDMEPYLKDKGIMRYETAIRELNSLVAQDGIYAIPSELSAGTPLTPSEDAEPIYGAYLRWDAYKELGYPEIGTLEDLLPILKQMQEMIPYGDTGNKTYAFSFFKDWDGNLMTAAKQPACLYGYDEYGFVLAKADGSDYQSIIDDDSQYVRALRFYFQANQMGLVDPDSLSQNYDSVFAKYQNGDILFCVWPWLAQSAYNTISHKEEGKGFMHVSIQDSKIYSYGCNAMGNPRTVIGIGSKAEDPERLADFIDWLYSSEGISINEAQSLGGAAGPEGLTWEMTEDGPALTEFGIQALMNGEVEVPAEWGGGLWLDGTSALNFKAVVLKDLDENGNPYAYSLWDSVMNMDETKLDTDWREHMGADTTMEYLQKENMLIVAPGCEFKKAGETAEIVTLRNQCKTVVVEYSWKMIFAKSEAEFETLLDTMQIKLKSLGYDRVFAIDLENAKLQDEARQKAVEKYGSQ